MGPVRKNATMRAKGVERMRCPFRFGGRQKNLNRIGSQREGSFLLQLRLLLLPFRDILGRAGVELIAATRAADVVGLAHVGDGGSPGAAGDDALGPTGADGEGLAFLGGAHRPLLRKERSDLRL